MSKQPLEKRNEPKDVRELDQDLVNRRVNALLNYLFGAQRDCSSKYYLWEHLTLYSLNK